MGLSLGETNFFCPLSKKLHLSGTSNAMASHIGCRKFKFKNMAFKSNTNTFFEQSITLKNEENTFRTISITIFEKNTKRNTFQKLSLNLKKLKNF